MRYIYGALFLSMLSLLFSSTVVPQQAVTSKPNGSAPSNASQGNEPKPAPPPQAAPPRPPEGPSLHSTMQLIHDQVLGVGEIDSTISWVNDRTGRTGQNTGLYRITHFDADASGCRISYGLANPNAEDTEFSFDMKDIESVHLSTFDQTVDELHVAHGYPELHSTIDPPEWGVYLTIANSPQGEWYFLDQESANRVGAAVRRAMALCGHEN